MGIFFSLVVFLYVSRFLAVGVLLLLRHLEYSIRVKDRKKNPLVNARVGEEVEKRERERELGLAAFFSFFLFFLKKGTVST